MVGPGQGEWVRHEGLGRRPDRDGDAVLATTGVVIASTSPCVPHHRVLLPADFCFVNTRAWGGALGFMSASVFARPVRVRPGYPQARPGAGGPHSRRGSMRPTNTH